MPMYGFECTSCGREFDYYARMSEIAHASPGCPYCHGTSRRIFSVPQYSEDRTRFFRGATGTRYSHMLGQDMPESRSEFHRICEQKGIEPVSRASIPSHWKEAASYARHVRDGGERVDPASVVPKEPIEGVKSVRDMVRENPEKFRSA